MKRQTARSSVSASKIILDYIVGLPNWRGKTMSKVRKCFRDANPEMLEEWKWMGTPTWSPTV